MAKDGKEKRTDHPAGRSTRAVCLVIGLLAAGLAHDAAAQPDATPSPKRPLDFFPGIVASCAPASELAWTIEACAELLADVQRQAKALGIPTGVRSAGASVKDAGIAAGFDGDRAIILQLKFELLGDKRNRVGLDLAAHFIWVPTEKEIPNVVPGQRIPQHLFSQGASTYESTRRKDLMPFAKRVLDNFFRVGQGKPSLDCPSAIDAKDCRG